MRKYLRRILVAMPAVLMVPTLAYAVDCTGMKGYWLDTSKNECVTCNGAGVYCPGDNIRHDCPDIQEREVPLYPAEYPEMVLSRKQLLWYSTMSSKITDCYLTYLLEDGRSTMSYIQQYNPDTDKYDTFYDHYRQYMYPGYYLTMYRTCMTGAVYDDVALCEAGGYCPGEASWYVCANGPAPANYGLYTCPDNTYSDSGAAECTPCPAGTGNHGDKLSDHAGVGSCLPIRCDAGAYLDDRTCRDCKYGLTSNAAVYCPGDNARYDCPTSNTNYNSLAYPDVMIAGGEAAFSWETARGAQSCFGGLTFQTPDGSLYYAECAWNGSNYYSPCTGTATQGYLYYSAGTGYYLSDYWFTTSRTWYHGVKACTNKPANSHYTGPGEPEANNCPWECDSGYGRHADECLPLCDAGATRLHTPNLAFNMYSRENCGSPALYIGFGDSNKCCVNLRADAAHNAINIQYNGQIYHTTD